MYPAVKSLIQVKLHIAVILTTNIKMRKNLEKKNAFITTCEIILVTLCAVTLGVVFAT